MSRAHRITLNHIGQNLIRILIGSYFLAISAGIIPGLDRTVLTSTLLPQPFAEYAGITMLYGLSIMIMAGLWLRAAALLLSLFLFWSGYIKMLELGVASQLSHFWRDLALIGALMLTYVETDAGTVRRRGLLRRQARARNAKDMIQPRRVTPVSNMRGITPLPPNVTAIVKNLPLDHPDDDPNENIFREGGLRLVS